MKYFLFLIVCSFSTLVFSQQQDVNLFYENNSRGYTLYATNKLFCPVSVLLELDMQNLFFSERDQRLFIIPARTEKVKLGMLRIKDHQISNRFLYHYKLTYGNVNQKEYDTSYVYDLPYQKGQTFLLFQGYNGNMSHQNQNALDFYMPLGTPIVAAREGIVFKVVQKNDTSCLERSCAQFNNYVSIYHPDGTIGYYAHIRHNGAIIKEGDTVKRGDLIAYSGGTGWSTGPHLHFSCFFPDTGNNKTVMTKFKIADGSLSDYLKEKEIYSKNY